MILNTIKAYKLLIDAYGGETLQSRRYFGHASRIQCHEILERLRSETGIPIEVITGDAEASFIYENHIAEKPR